MVETSEGRIAIAAAYMRVIALGQVPNRVDIEFDNSRSYFGGFRFISPRNGREVKITAEVLVGSPMGWSLELINGDENFVVNPNAIMSCGFRYEEEES